MWAEHDSMTFVGLGDGGRAQFCLFFLFWQAVYFLGVLDAFALFMSTRGHSQRIITPELIAGSSFMDKRL